MSLPPFHRPQTLALGVCNGCQMMSNLRELIPEATCGRALCVTIPTVLKRASARLKSRKARLCCCRAWPVR